MKLSTKRWPVFKDNLVEVEVSFEMGDHDWHRLLESRLWHRLEAYIETHETKDNRPTKER